MPNVIPLCMNDVMTSAWKKRATAKRPSKTMCWFIRLMSRISDYHLLLFLWCAGLCKTDIEKFLLSIIL